MKLVIDRDEQKRWRWSLVTIAGVSVKVHAQGTVDGDMRAAFEAGQAEAIAKGYIKAAPVEGTP